MSNSNVASAVDQALTAAPPNWDKLDHDIVCPLCGYNLRGLSDPRCPECGHRSTWAKLTALSEEQRWFFETTTGGKLRAILCTWALSLFPIQFWRRVRPRDEPRVEHLFLFSKLLALGMILIALTPGALDLVFRLWRYAIFASPPPRSGWGVSLYYTLVSWLRPILSSERGYRSGSVLLRTLLGMMAWPWLTVLTPLIFQQTLRRARINSGHVVRVAVYTSSIGIVLLIPLTWSICRFASHGPWISPSEFSEAGFIYPVLVVLMVMTYRLWTAYRLYMRIPHAFATALASQVIVTLVLYIAALGSLM